MIDLTVWKNRYHKFLDNPRAIFAFLKKHLYYVFIADAQLAHYKNFKFYDYKQTINEIIDKNRSIVRFGDELFDMLQGIGLYYNDWHQSYDPLLAQRLKEIISSKDPRILVCFNPEFILKTQEDFSREGIPEQWQFWVNSKIFLKNFYHKDIVYGSALCFTPRYNKHINFHQLKAFFEKKHIVIITSNTHRFKGLRLGKTTDLLEAPQSNAWGHYDTIKNTLFSLLHENSYLPDTTLVLISIGSAAKVLVYDTTLHGYTAWDTGQFFDLASKEIAKMDSATEPVSG